MVAADNSRESPLPGEVIYIPCRIFFFKYQRYNQHISTHKSPLDIIHKPSSRPEKLNLSSRKALCIKLCLIDYKYVYMYIQSPFFKERRIERETGLDKDLKKCTNMTPTPPASPRMGMF